MILHPRLTIESTPQDQRAVLADLLGTEGCILELCDEPGDAQKSYDTALGFLMQAEAAFEQLDTLCARSTHSPDRDPLLTDTLAFSYPISADGLPLEPVYLPLLATLLRQKGTSASPTCRLCVKPV